MSQGDLLMQRKRHNNGEFADQEQTRRHPNAATTTIPSRKSVIEPSQMMDSWKKSSTSKVKGRPSVILTAPSSGALAAGYGGNSPTKDNALDTMEMRQREVIAQRKREEEEVKALNELGRSDYHSMLREKERIRLRQRTQAREELENKTLPALCGSARTVAAAQREAKKTLPQQTKLATNRDRIEVNLIRRQEELELTARRQSARRDLEMTSGTSYAQSQSQLRSTLNQSAAKGLCNSAGSITTPEEIHAVELLHEEVQWQEQQEAEEIKRAMDELDALDQRLHREEMQRKDVRMAKKKELREASMRK